MAKIFKSGGVSQCFHCNRQLVRGGGKDGFTFNLIYDPDNNPVRVHKACQSAAIGHGYTEFKKQ